MKTSRVQRTKKRLIFSYIRDSRHNRNAQLDKHETSFVHLVLEISENISLFCIQTQKHNPSYFSL